MNHTYRYQGFAIEVGVETDFHSRSTIGRGASLGYVATVRILWPGLPVAVFSPLRFGDTRDRLFASEADALIGGCSAGQRLVDDLSERGEPDY